MSIQEDISRIAKSLIFKEPFYGLFLLTLNKEVDERVETAGVSKLGINCQLTIAPSFWNTLSDPHKLGLIKHELLHIVFFHLQYRDSFGDWELFNIAADLEINQYIDKSWLPPGALVLSMFPDLNLSERQGTKYYYDELSKAKKSGKLKLPSLGPGNCTCPDSNRGSCEDMHKTWAEFAGMSESEKGLLKKQVDYQIRDIIENNKSCGKVPGELQQYIDSLLNIKPPVFDWKAYLRRFMGSSSKVYTKKTRRKLNKRFEGLPALKIKTKNHILVGVDTSGSVSDRELLEFFSEIHHMYKTGVVITVAQCDADIHDISEYKGRFDGRIVGRGGTSFQPLIDYYDQNRNKYSTCIYLTDGYCGAPTKPRGSILWVISSSGDANRVFPGHKIKIPAINEVDQ